MAKRNKKHSKTRNEDQSYYTKFKKVHLRSNGILTICAATTVDGVEEYYGWDTAKNREFVRNNVTSDVEIIVDKGVTKGWDYEFK